MDYPLLQALNGRNEKAANSMVSDIARGVHAGNPDITAQAAATLALETGEEILTQLDFAIFPDTDGDNS